MGVAKPTLNPETVTTRTRMPQDKQLVGINLADVLNRRRLDQALNAKEFAVLAGVSYSTARAWFRLPGFPALNGLVFWSDFVRWRQEKVGVVTPSSGFPLGTKPATTRSHPETRGDCRRVRSEFSQKQVEPPPLMLVMAKAFAPNPAAPAKPGCDLLHFYCTT